MYRKELSQLQSGSISISELAGRKERVLSRIINSSDSRLMEMHFEVLKEITQRMEKEIMFAVAKFVEKGQNLNEVERKILQWMIKDNPDSTWIEMHRKTLKRIIQRMKEAQKLAEEARKRAKEAQRLAEEARKRTEEAQRLAEEARKRTEEKKNREIMEKESDLRNHPIYKHIIENPWLPRKYKS
jgi:predicted DNA-binding protein (UPF0278 family)